MESEWIQNNIYSLYAYNAYGSIYGVCVYVYKSIACHLLNWHRTSFYNQINTYQLKLTQLSHWQINEIYKENLIKWKESVGLHKNLIFYQFIVLKIIFKLTLIHTKFIALSLSFNINNRNYLKSKKKRILSN